MALTPNIGIQSKIEEICRILDYSQNQYMNDDISCIGSRK